MAIITEVNDDDQAQQDHQIQPMESEQDQTGDGVDIGRQILNQQIAAEREQYQPSASEKIFAIVKSMLMRGMVIYFIMSLFRKPQQTGKIFRILACSLGIIRILASLNSRFIEF